MPTSMILREKASYGSSKFTDCGGGGGGPEFQHSKQLFLQNSDSVFQVPSFDEFSTFIESSKERSDDFWSPFSLSKHFHFFVSPLKKGSAYDATCDGSVWRLDVLRKCELGSSWERPKLVLFRGLDRTQLPGSGRKFPVNRSSVFWHLGAVDLEWGIEDLNPRFFWICNFSLYLWTTLPLNFVEPGRWSRLITRASLKASIFQS